MLLVQTQTHVLLLQFLEGLIGKVVLLQACLLPKQPCACRAKHFLQLTLAARGCCLLDLLDIPDGNGPLLTGACMAGVPHELDLRQFVGRRRCFSRACCVKSETKRGKEEEEEDPGRGNGNEQQNADGRAATTTGAAKRTKTLVWWLVSTWERREAQVSGHTLSGPLTTGPLTTVATLSGLCCLAGAVAMYPDTICRRSRHPAARFLPASRLPALQHHGLSVH